MTWRLALLWIAFVAGLAVIACLWKGPMVAKAPPKPARNNWAGHPVLYRSPTLDLLVFCKVYFPTPSAEVRITWYDPRTVTATTANVLIATASPEGVTLGLKLGNKVLRPLKIASVSLLVLR